MEKIIINTEYIKLDQFLKFINVVDGGGMAKVVILEKKVKVNDEVEIRRGRKLRNGDSVEYENEKYVILKEE